MAKKQSLPDPASDGAYEWTKSDIDGMTALLGRQMMDGKFNPKTWEGDNVEYTFVDGTTRMVIPKYFGMVHRQWQDKFGD